APVSDRRARVLREALVARSLWHSDPGRLRIKENVLALLRRRQLGVDRRSERIDPFLPARIPDPQRARATLAEVPSSGRAGLCARRELRAIDAEVSPALDLQRVREAHEVDHVAATAAGLAADRAVAPQVGIRRSRSAGD